MSDLSVTAASNSPPDTENLVSVDDYLRSISSLLRHTNAKGTDIASAATTSIGAATGEFVHVTGTTTITSFGTNTTAGIRRIVLFTGALTLTHNATSLILPTGANITTEADDVAFVLSLGSNNWRVLGYLRKSGLPLSTSFTDSTFEIKDNSDATKKVAFQVSGVTTGTTRTLTVPNANGTIALTSDIPAAQSNATSSDVNSRTSSSLTVTPASLQGFLVSGTVTATTSGTSIDFTSIPSWAKRITMTFSGISVSGTSPMQVQLGDSGGIETTSYLGAVGGSTSAQNSSGFLLIGTSSATVVLHGALVLTLHDAATFTWVAQGSFGRSDSAQAYMQGGSKALSAALDRVRLTTVNGTDTFDAGSFNIIYE